MSPSATAAAPEVRAEILKLARLLRREPDTLCYLEDVPAADLRVLRDQVTEVLFSANEAALGRLAAASRLLPSRVVAAIGERAFGPVLSARITGRLDPDRAVEMAATMPIPFLADVAVELDPRRASAGLARIPPARVAEITRELLARGEYVTMGRFVGHLEDAAVRAAVAEMDETALLRVGFVLESKDGLEDLIAMLPPERLERIVEVAAREHLWVEVLDLLTHVDEDRRLALAEQARSLDDAALAELVEHARAAGMLEGHRAAAAGARGGRLNRDASVGSKARPNRVGEPRRRLRVVREEQRGLAELELEPRAARRLRPGSGRRGRRAARGGPRQARRGRRRPPPLAVARRRGS